MDKIICTCDTGWKKVHGCGCTHDWNGRLWGAPRFYVKKGKVCDGDKPRGMMHMSAKKIVEFLNGALL